jgi:hypothetical protein
VHVQYHHHQIHVRPKKNDQQTAKLNDAGKGLCVCQVAELVLQESLAVGICTSAAKHMAGGQALSGQALHYALRIIH